MLDSIATRYIEETGVLEIHAISPAYQEGEEIEIVEGFPLFVLYEDQERIDFAGLTEEERCQYVWDRYSDRVFKHLMDDPWVYHC